MGSVANSTVAHSISIARVVAEADTRDQQVAANRNPVKLADRTITFQAVAVPLTVRPVPGQELLVMFNGLGRPRNLSFRLTPELATKVSEAMFTPNGLYKVRLTGKVGAVPAEGERS